MNKNITCTGIDPKSYSFEFSTLPQSLHALWPISLDLFYLNNTLKTHDDDDADDNLVDGMRLRLWTAATN
jgi:hypothetical protein